MESNQRYRWHHLPLPIEPFAYVNPSIAVSASAAKPNDQKQKSSCYTAIILVDVLNTPEAEQLLINQH